MFSSICSRTFILAWCSLCISLSHAFNTQHIQHADTSSTIAIVQTSLNEEQITTLATSLHAHAKNNLGLDIDHNAQYLIHRIKLFLSFRAHQHEDICQEARTFCYINQLDYTAENLGPKFTELQTEYGAPSLSLLFKHLLIRPAHDTISEATIAYDFSVLLCQYWQTISTPLDRAQASIDLASSLTTLARKPFTQDQITVLAQQAIASCMTPQIRKYKETFQRKLAALLTFRSQLQSESLSDRSAKLIIKQQGLDNGYIQADQHDDTLSTSPDANKQSWWQVFKNKLLTESANEQTEISWAHETASLLVQYWPTFVSYKSQKQRKRIESLMDSIENDTAADAQPTTIAKVPLTQDQITTIAQQAIAGYMTPQTCMYEATLQKKLSALLDFRSKMQRESLRSQSAGLIISQQHLDVGYIQADQHANTIASSSPNKQSWNSLFKKKLLIESADEQAEISWAHEIASLLVQYWPIYNTYMAQKRREHSARKRDKADDSVEETDDLLRKNRRHNDSPIPFVPVADEQTPASTFFELIHSNHDADAAFFQEAHPDSMVFDLPTPTIEDYFHREEHNEN